ncbi:MAG: DUF192 domain-containing protein [Patescibacteria group bacterium]|nr:DUF192 domain-containing protein [Patescibacteria group bacterium]
MSYAIGFIAAFILSIAFTLLVKKIALKIKLIDFPDFKRKIHKTPIPLLGGLAVFFSFALILVYYAFFTDLILFDFIVPKYVLGIILAGLVVIAGGILDDKFNLKPRYQIIFPIVATLIIIGSGIGISHIRNPFGGIISFNNWQLILFWLHGTPYKITLLADLFTFIWLLGMMYTTKLLDGLDGLVSGVTVIGCLVIAFVALSKTVAQPNTALIALILAGAFAGFLLFNFNPAKIFLGEGGSLFAGLMLGTLAIISGSKVATTLLILGVPILDVIWVILRRIFYHRPISFADKTHLHFRLLDIGFSQRQAVIFIYVLTALFGGASLFLQSFGKMIELIILSVFMLVLAVTLVVIYKNKNNNLGPVSKSKSVTLRKNMNKKNLKILVPVAVVLIFIALVACVYFYYVQSAMATVTIRGHVIKAQVADSPEEQALGLSGKKNLGDNSGLLFVYSDSRYRTFWMKDMKFPIDIIWINDNKIVYIEKNAPVPADPENPAIFTKGEVNRVLEVKAGWTDKNNIQVGDEVGIKF